MVKWSRIDAPDFDLEKTLNCGQVFHWQQQGAGFAGAIGGKAVLVEQRGKRLRFCGVGREELARYFALDHPLADICASFPRDETMAAASEFCRGLRLIRQPRWECLATFICSSMKQVAHIRQMSLALRERFGVRRGISVTHVYDFPSPERIGRTTEAELRECGLGYRAKNLLATAKRVASGEARLEEWASLDDVALRAKLCELPGVGVKVANCVMLFAYERTTAFPIDVWIARVLREQYFSRRRKVTAKLLADFSASYFGPHGGYAQQYLFHHARTNRLRPRRPTEEVDGTVFRAPKGRGQSDGAWRCPGCGGAISWARWPAACSARMK